jgi:hypothetical protein
MSGCAGGPLVPAAEQAEAATAAGDAEGGPRQLRHRAGSRVRPPSNSNVDQTVLTMVADNLRVVFWFARGRPTDAAGIPVGGTAD